MNWTSPVPGSVSSKHFDKLFGAPSKVRSDMLKKRMTLDSNKTSIHCDCGVARSLVTRWYLCSRAWVALSWA